MYNEINKNIKKETNDNTYKVQTSPVVLVILGLLTLLSLYGSVSFITSVINQLNEKMIYILIWIIWPLFLLIVLVERVSFKKMVTGNTIKIRNIFFKSKEYEFREIYKYVSTSSKFYSGIDIFIGNKKTVSVTTFDRGYEYLYKDLKDKVNIKQPDYIGSYVLGTPINATVIITTFLTVIVCLTMIILPRIYEEKSIAFLYGILPVIGLLLLIRVIFSKMYVDEETIKLRKPPFKSKFYTFNDLEKIYNYFDFIEVYIDGKNVFQFKKEFNPSYDRFLNDAQKNNVTIRKIGNW